MKTFKKILPFALMIIALFIWTMLGEGNGHHSQSNAFDYLAIGVFVLGLFIIAKRNWM